MEVREAVEADAERMADIADSPPDVMRNLVHDRTVRVACETRPDDGSRNERTGSDATREGENGDDREDLLGLVSFDARDDTVHVTQLAGTSAACARLLEEPMRFARSEGMGVELLVSETDDDARRAVEGAGFTASGAGPRFRGEETTRYRLEPGRAEQ